MLSRTVPQTMTLMVHPSIRQHSAMTMSPGNKIELIGLSAGSTFYVTLEPCHHTGRTPPCDRRLIEVGAARVVIAFVDPDDRVNGQGIAYRFLWCPLISGKVPNDFSNSTVS